MKFFLDSGKIDEITYAYENWAVNGVTTNPRHIHATGRSLRDVTADLAREFNGIDFPISIEVNPHLDRADEMAAQASEIAAQSENFVVKIPCTEQGLIAAKKLCEQGTKVNATLVFSASQALQIGRLKAAYVSPFVGWKEASGEDYFSLLEDIVAIYENYDFATEIIVAAVRNGRHIVDAAVLGADIVTAGYATYQESFYHPFTDHGMKIFQDAWDKTDTT